MDSDQLSDLCCPICFSTFSERENVPHMLKCGHTHCSECLVNLINGGDGKCGECRAAIATRTVQTLPINYSVLRVIDALKSKESKHNEFHEVEQTIDAMMSRLNENQNMCKSSLHDIHKKIDDLEKEKKELKESKQNILRKYSTLSKSKSLSESLIVIKETVNKIKQLEEQHKTINERLQKEHELGKFQSLIDEPQDFTIVVDNIYKLQTTCFFLNKKLYVRAIPPNLTNPPKYEVNYNLLRPFFIRTFMIIEYEGRSSLLEFELFKGNHRAKQFAQICLAEHSIGYKDAHFYEHFRSGKEGESVMVGHFESSIHKVMVKDLQKGACRVEYIKKGFVEGISNDKMKGTHFRIYLESIPNLDSKYCFAKLVRGGSILKSILNNKLEVNIVESGHIFDLSLNV